jgi:hypothetical protein
MSLIVLMTVLVIITRVDAQQYPEVQIMSATTRHADYVWKLPESRLRQLPKWNRLRDRPPLAPEKALKIADKWVAHNFVPYFLLEIRIMRCRSDPYKDVFYYVMEYEKPAFDVLRVVVLMDGTILQPKEIEDRKSEK